MSAQTYYFKAVVLGSDNAKKHLSVQLPVEKLIRISNHVYAYQKIGALGNTCTHSHAIKGTQLSSQIPNAFFVIILYDITSQQTYKEANELYKTKCQNNLQPGSYIYIIGNKTDLITKREVPYTNAKVYAKGNSMLFIETCSLSESKKNIDLVIKILKMKASFMSVNLIYKNEPQIITNPISKYEIKPKFESNHYNELNMYDNIDNIEDRLIETQPQAQNSITDSQLPNYDPDRLKKNLEEYSHNIRYDTLQDVSSKPYVSETHIKDYSLPRQSTEQDIKVMQPNQLNAPYEIIKDPTPQFQTQNNDRYTESPNQMDLIKEAKSMNLCQPYKSPFTYEEQQAELSSVKPTMKNDNNLYKKMDMPLQIIKNNKIDEIDNKIKDVEMSLQRIENESESRSHSSLKSTERLRELIPTLQSAGPNKGKHEKTPIIKAVVAAKPREVRLSLKDQIKRKEDANLFYLNFQCDESSFVQVEVKQSDTPRITSAKCLTYLGKYTSERALLLSKVIAEKVNRKIADIFSKPTIPQKDKGKEIIKLSVFISKNDSIQFGICERDDPSKLANEIAKKYRLPIEKIDMLKNSISNSLSDYRKKHSKISDKSCQDDYPPSRFKSSFVNERRESRVSPKSAEKKKNPRQHSKEKSRALSVAKTHRDVTPCKIKPMRTERIPNELLFKMNFNLNSGQSAKIQVHEGDNLFRLAYNFVITHKLGENSIDKVYSVLEKTYQAHKSKQLKTN